MRERFVLSAIVIGFFDLIALSILAIPLIPFEMTSKSLIAAIVFLVVLGSELCVCEDDVNTKEERAHLEEYRNRLDELADIGWLRDHFKRLSACDNKGELNLRVEAYLKSQKSSEVADAEELMRLVRKLAAKDDKDLDDCETIMHFSLAALGSVLDANVKCSEQSEQILRSVDQLTSFRITMSSELSGISKSNIVQTPLLDRMIRYYIEAHANECSKLYSTLADRKLDNEMDPIDRKRLFAVFGSSSLASLIIKKPKLYLELSLSGPEQSQVSEYDYYIARFLASQLTSVAEADGKPLVAGERKLADRFVSAFEQYILEPCRSYMDAMRPLIGPISYDIGSAAANRREFPYDIGFLMVRNALCRNVLARSKVFSAEVLQLLNQNPKLESE